MCTAATVATYTLFFKRKVVGNTVCAYTCVLVVAQLIGTMYMLFSGYAATFVAAMAGILLLYVGSTNWCRHIYIEYCCENTRIKQLYVYRVAYWLVITVEAFVFVVLFYVYFFQKLGYAADNPAFFFENSLLDRSRIVGVPPCDGGMYVTLRDELPRTFSNIGIIFFPMVGTSILVVSSYVANVNYTVCSLATTVTSAFLRKLQSCLGYQFLYIQLIEFGTYYSTSIGFARSSVLYILTGYHALHVVVGLILCTLLLETGAVGTIPSFPRTRSLRR